MVDRYEPYEPPAEPADEGGAPTPQPERQWPVLDPAPERPVVWRGRPDPPADPRTAPEKRGLGAVLAVVAVVGAIAIGVGSSQIEPAEPDVRDQWEQCLSEEADNGGLLEPEEICAISFPGADERYGDLGYDNPEDEYDWYLEDEYP